MVATYRELFGRKNLSATMIVAVTDAVNACRDEPDLIERIKKAMTRTHNHWMETDEQNQYHAAIVAVWMETKNPNQRDRLERSVKALNTLVMVFEAAKLGIPYDIEKIEAPAKDVIPLNRMWDETRIPV